MNKIIDLGGEWEIRQLNGDIVLKGHVPGLVHHDLINLKKVEDPFYRTNEKEQQWVGESTWEYKKEFYLKKEDTKRKAIVLDCEGLDTLTEIFINNKSIGKTDNMFIRWRFNIKNFIKEGKNTIKIIFYPAEPEMQKRAKNYTHELGGYRHAPWEPKNRNYLRKSHTHGGWDWGPCFLTQGIYRPIRLECRNGAKILYVTNHQKHFKEKVSLKLKAFIEVPPEGVYGKISFKVGDFSSEQTVWLKEGLNIVEENLSIDNPKLWWPNGMGEQNLYDLSCTLKSEDEIDTMTQKIGIRKVEVIREPDKYGESFFFKINDIPMYAKGADWIPGDSFDSRLSNNRISMDLTSAKEANFNIIRLWGGGLYERDFFYEECDRLGLLIWHDFMFACHLYPTNPEFLESVRTEIRHQIRRLQHHPSILLWCGNNENEQAISWHSKEKSEEQKMLFIAEYDQLYIQTIAPIVTEEDPERLYWPSSPSNGFRKYGNPNDPTRGDVHFWEVWHGDKPYQHYETIVPRFCSEFGFQAFPCLETMEECTVKEDRNISSPVAEHHQRSGLGNLKILYHIGLHFRLPFSFENLIYLSQVHQAEAIRYGIEHWRRNKPQNMGVIVWQLNDIWPSISWSSVDFRGRWKILHYIEKRSFAPLIVSGRFSDNSIKIWLVSDMNKHLKGTLLLSWKNFSGKTIKTKRYKVSIKPLESRVVFSDTVDKSITKIKDWQNEVFLEIRFFCKECDAFNLLFFEEYKRLNLKDPKIRYRIDKDGNLTLSCKNVALFVTANTGKAEGRWSDNSFHLLPGQIKKIKFIPWNKYDKNYLKRLKTNFKIYDIFSSFN